MTTLNAAIGLVGTHEALRVLDQSSETVLPYDSLVSILENTAAMGVTDTIEALLGSSLVHRSPRGYGISHLGRRTTILLDALNGGDLRDAWRRLAQLDPTLHHDELVRDNLADHFLESLLTRPSFGRIYICSPWINLDQRRRNILATAILRAEQGGREPEVLVITRPERGTAATAPMGTVPLQQLGATVHLNRRLHTKLYIREPDARGGYLMAILGSQNLTRSSYLELGIKIHSDTVIIQNLITYFLDLTNQSDEVE